MASFGPIPARAGQPCLLCDAEGCDGAYPRSRGATGSRTRCGSSTWGLSPLARGNRTGDRKHAIPPGPIPARAGQPLSSSRMLGASWAYPRSRGATGATRAMMDNSGGLSPLARGNPQDRIERLADRGPIPARAGQPPQAAGIPCARGAYPRSRGATFQESLPYRPLGGLSPLARGNRWQAVHCHPLAGPIPARAGQPCFAARVTCGRRAYPRSRGATSRT